MQTLDRGLTAARQREAPDACRKPRLPSIFWSFRRQGDLRTVSDVPGLTCEAIARLAVHLMNDRQRTDFEDYLGIAAPCRVRGGVRERGILFRRHGSVGRVLRVIPPVMPPLRRRNLSRAVLDLTLGSDAGGQDPIAWAAGTGGSIAAFRDDRRHDHATRTLEAHHIVTAVDPIAQSRGRTSSRDGS